MTCKYCDVFLGTDGDGVASHYPEGICPDCSVVRDQFAAATLSGLCAEDMSADDWRKHRAKIAALAFEMADAMMEARKKK